MRFDGLALFALVSALEADGDEAYATHSEEKVAVGSRNDGDGCGFDVVNVPQGSLIVVNDADSSYSTSSREELFGSLPEALLPSLEKLRFTRLSNGEIFASAVWYSDGSNLWQCAYGPRLPEDEKGDGGLGLLNPLCEAE
jgi:hypothetical protein